MILDIVFFVARKTQRLIAILSRLWPRPKDAPKPTYHPLPPPAWQWGRVQLLGRREHWGQFRWTEARLEVRELQEDGSYAFLAYPAAVVFATCTTPEATVRGMGGSLVALHRIAEHLYRGKSQYTLCGISLGSAAKSAYGGGEVLCRDCRMCVPAGKLPADIHGRPQ